MEFIIAVRRPTAWAIEPENFDPDDPLARLEATADLPTWNGNSSLLTLNEEVETGWFRDSHPEAWHCWQQLQETFTVVQSRWLGTGSLKSHRVGLSSPSHLQSLFSRPALSDAIDAVEQRCRLRCLDPEMDDLLGVVTFLRRHQSLWVLIACPNP